MTRPIIVLLGMMSRMPVPGAIWETVQYLLGFQRLGYDVHYVEAHGAWPGHLTNDRLDDGARATADVIASVMTRFDLGDKWAYHAIHADGQCYGKSAGELERLYRSAAAIINLSGSTIPRPEHYATDLLVFLETDPCGVQVELAEGVQEAVEFLEPHRAFFTWGENLGAADCGLPVSDRFTFLPTRQPILLDFWAADEAAPTAPFTTIAAWHQEGRDFQFEEERYYWSKDREFRKFLDLPRRTSQGFELALSDFDAADRDLLEAHGWQVRESAECADSLDAYRGYIAGSRGEFTVAKDQNIRLRSGWFSDRSASYLASSRPVVTQDTGFANVLPTGAGLFSFLTMEEATSAIDEINSDYRRHCRAARELAAEHFAHDVVLGRLLEDIGLPRRHGTGPTAQPVGQVS